MIGNPRGSDQRRVLGIVEREPGLPAMLVMWRLAGGAVKEGVGATGDVTIGFAEAVKLVSAEKRLADLVRKGLVVRGKARIGIDSSATGYYPAVAPPPDQPGPRPAVAASTVPGAKKTGERRLKEIRAMLATGRSSDGSG